MARDSTVPSRARARAGIKRSRRASRSKAGGRERGGTTLGMAPTRGTPRSPAPNRALTAVTTASAASEAGKRRETRRKVSVRTTVSTARARHQMLAWGRPCSAAKIWLKKPAGLGPVRPSTVLICPTAMSRAAPVVKATMTEWEMKLARSPSRARPMPIWISPQSTASPKT